MKKKYAILVNWILSEMPNALVSDSNNILLISIGGMSGTTKFRIMQFLGTVYIKYAVNSIVFGEHKLKWSFPVDYDQERMIQKIQNDVESLNSRIARMF